MDKNWRVNVVQTAVGATCYVWESQGQGARARARAVATVYVPPQEASSPSRLLGFLAQQLETPPMLRYHP